MKKLHLLFPFILCLVWTKQLTYGQTTDATKDNSPYELMSGYYNHESFKPFKKGVGYVGLAFSLEDKKSLNSQGLIQNVINGDNLDYNILFKGGFYSANYGMVGLNFGYSQSKFTGLVFRDPDTIQTNSMTRGYSLTPNLRAPIPLTANERFSFFVELDLRFGMANTVLRNTKNIDEISKTYTTEYLFGVGISPGIIFFAMENFAFEVQLNVVSYSIDVTDSEIDGVEQSRDVRQNINLDIDLLTLDLGLAYYFGANK